MSQITMTPADAMITLENVNKWYGQFHVLKDINLKVKQGNASSFAALPAREIHNHSLY
jgi:ABC-type sugar transport system ATPase subunit